MEASRIAELLTSFLSPDRSGFSREDLRPGGGDETAALAEPQLRSISTYIDMLLRWNARVNLTAIRDEEEIVTRHFGESLFAARHLFPLVPPAGKGVRLADVGSGAGFPGVPVKLWVPEIFLTLIESNHKKATFLRELARALTLADVNIQNTRAETLAPHSFDVVTLRAAERFQTILPIAAGLLTPGGRLALLIGSSQIQAAQAMLPVLNWSQPIPLPESRSRVLAIATVLPKQERT